VSQEEEYMKRPEIKVWIPDELKVALVDDWEAVTKNQQVQKGLACSPAVCDRLAQLVPLPRDPSVQQILSEFEEYSKTAKGVTCVSSAAHLHLKDRFTAGGPSLSRTRSSRA
jgi:mortality factor 4-like protein 1